MWRNRPTRLRKDEAMDSRQIEEYALAWLAKRDSGKLTEAEEAGFGEWIRQDVAHRVAYLRLEAAWERAARLKAFGVGRTPNPIPPPGEWRTSPFFERRPALPVRSVMKRRAPRMAAIAAGTLLAIVGTLWLRGLHDEAYATPVGGIASFPLKDGSSITLNTSSKVRVALTQKERHIALESGEAFFEVAKDSTRPFVVDAGDRRIVAVGTAFSVRREAADVQVVVTHGTVRVEPKTGREDVEWLTAGAVMHAARESLLVQKKTRDEAEKALSWRTGYLTFDETSLANAVAEFNRYTTQRIIIDDPKLAALKISGKFRTTNVDDFVKLLRDGFGIHARSAGGTIELALD